MFIVLCIFCFYLFGCNPKPLGSIPERWGYNPKHWAIAQCFKKTVFVLKNKERIAGECVYIIKNGNKKVPNNRLPPNSV